MDRVTCVVLKIPIAYIYLHKLEYIKFKITILIQLIALFMTERITGMFCC